MIIYNKRLVIILGAGGHAKVIANALIQSGRNVMGLVAPDEEEGTVKFGIKVLGNDDSLDSYSNSEILLANGIGVLPGESLRWDLSHKMRAKGFEFVNVIHPSAIVASDVVFEEGVQVIAGAIIQPSVYIGRDTIINTASRVDHDCQIRENCHLSPGVTLSGGIKVGEGSHLGTGTIVIQNISIGSNCVIAAGSVIYKDLKDATTLIQSKQTMLKTEGV